MELNSIKNSVQEVAEAIAAVLHVDVTIIDHNFKRIASTGNYKTRIGDKLPSKCLYEYVMNEKSPHYVERNAKSHGKNSICDSCEASSTCKETATIGYPIMNGDQVVGVIGINIFDEEQYNNISGDLNSMIKFLGRLSSLLVGNIHYIETIDKLQIHKKETNHIMNGLSNGVVCVDDKGYIKYINEKGKKLLGINDEDEDIDIRDFLKEINLKFLADNVGSSFLEVNGSNNKPLMIKGKPITIQGKTVSYIIQLTKKSEEVRAAYKLFVNSKEVRFNDIIGESRAINSVKALASNVATTNATVLIQGESGTGKELFARAIHSESPRHNAPFIAVNCASIPDNLLESEFFGYEGGTFTGARKEGHTGKFELANGGTIFLDEIGDLPLHLQPKILRVLQEQSFTKIGGKDEIHVDVRIIAATNKNLQDMVSEGQFRDDLYYRLNVIPLYLPSLIDREEDTLLLSRYLLSKYCKKYDVEEKRFSEEVKAAFRSYRWPGNIRELENIIEYLVNVSKDTVITEECLPAVLKNIDKTSKKCGMSLKDRVNEYEKNLLKSMLDNYGDNADGKNKICKELSIDLSTLYRKLNKHDLQ